MERTYKSEARYLINSQLTQKDIEEAYRSGEPLTGKVISYDEVNETVDVYLGNDIIGVLPWSEATIYDFNYYNLTELNDIPRQIIGILYKKVRVKVIGFSNNNIYLSRKKNMLEALQDIIKNPTQIFDGVVTGKYRYGVFYDIGEGITAFCHMNDFSSTRISNFGTWVSIGEQHRVIINGLNLNDNFKINCSRKDACSSEKGYDYFKPNQIVRVRISDPVYQGKKITGYFAEVNPRVSGIVDIINESHSLRAGDFVTALIKSVNVEARKVKMKAIF